MERTNSDLNSALALFQSLYKAQKGDIYTIIERFILVGVKNSGMLSFTKEEITQLLKDTFNLDIPFSVIQRCIILHQDVFKYSRNKYVVINPMDADINQIIIEMGEIDEYKKKVISDLISFGEEKKNVKFSDEEKEQLGNTFFNFVVDKEHLQEKDDKLIITQFIITKEKDERFQDFLNSIKEGMIIYRGIRYSDSPNDTTWEYNTDFFLDVEYLFNAYGMNGPFFEKCFFEFYNLVKEINNASVLKGGRKRIRLFYFPETKINIDSYFAQAVRIRRMEERYNNPQVAMDNILSKCKDDVDVERYKSNFFIKLKELQIVEFTTDIDLNRNKDYLFENKLFEKEKDRYFEVDQLDEVNEYVKIADYINILREGRQSRLIEKCRFMFLSEGKLSNELSHFIKDFYKDTRPVVIARMGSFTELMWFRLKKGVIDTNSSATINVVNKAKAIVSGLLQDHLKKQYDAVLALDEDDSTKKAYYADLRTIRYTPDSVNSETIAEDIAFIDDTDYVIKYEQSQELLKKQASRAAFLEDKLIQEKKEKEELKAQIHSFKEYIIAEERRKAQMAIKSARHSITFIRFIYKYYEIFFHLIITIAFILPSFLCMKKEWVNIATVGSFYIGIELLIVGFFKKRKRLVRRMFVKKYRRIIQREQERYGVTKAS